MNEDAKGLRQWRKERLLTIAGLATAAGCAYRTVRMAEVGEATPQPGTIKRLSAALGVEPAAVVEFRRAMGLPVQEAGR